MTRPIIGKMKTIVLPTDSLAEDIKGYEEKTGIDLTKVFDILIDANGGVYLPNLKSKSDNQLILFSCGGGEISPIGNFNWFEYTEDGDGVTIGHVTLDAGGDVIGGFGLTFTADQDNPTLEGLKISFAEI